MPAELKNLRRCIQGFAFKQLFIEELNWDRLQIRPPVFHLGGSSFTLTPIAEKRGFQIFACSPDAIGQIPEDKLRRKIDRELTKLAAEHLIIFVDAAHTAQTWQWVKRAPGQPLAFRSASYHQGQSGELLAQKLSPLFVSFAEEEGLFIGGVGRRVQRGFDVDRVTKRFYERFKQEHGVFLKFIQGIQATADQEWYASLMLNRLMFIYFIQKKGFLDGDEDYLRNRLKQMQRQAGRDSFHSFYRYFLLRLFHEGLGGQRRDAELEALLGRIPYLNGGLFDLHELERANADIQIADAAFEKVFGFFDAYQWHLDDRPLRSDTEINPDVLGYIFEKYINQKQMGAYYTKEDITGYISQNTVIPFLFDAAQRRCPIAFEPDGALWRLLRENPNRYVYEAVRKGVIDENGALIPLPDNIAAGLDDVSQRGGWNADAGAEFALPTETWREHIARRRRCLEVREKLAAGAIHSVNDLITYNLDIRQFAQDVIDNCEGPELLRAFYRAVAGHLKEKSNEETEAGVSILDPTCGSGAFLFAALNILEPLYDACLERMQGFLDETASESKFPDFRRILARVAQHPGRRYFILKAIIIGNLHGVDLMPEAVEICKLRLFLKLVAQLERWEQIEPLPDIDFNIRAGNTLVGFATYDEAARAVQSKLAFDDTMSGIDEKAEDAARAFALFRTMQTAHDMDAAEFHAAKDDLRQRLLELDAELDRYLAGEYGVNPDKTQQFAAWRASHQPFHWFVEFYAIMKNGGFNVIIGNPPYVEYSEVKGTYSIINYVTEHCGNLYAYTWERCVQLASDRGHLGMIVPVASVCTDGYMPLQTVLKSSGSVVVSNFNDRPSKLFDGLEHIRLSVILLKKTKSARSIFSTTYNKWQTVERENLFENLSFAENTLLNLNGAIAKLGTSVEKSILEKVSRQKRTLGEFAIKLGASKIYYTRKLSHFVQILDFIPNIYDGLNQKRQPSELKEIVFESQLKRDVFLALLNSSLFYWLLTVYSDCRNLNKRELYSMKFDYNQATPQVIQRLQQLSNELMRNINATSKMLRMGKLQIQCTYPKLSKPIIDEIDRVLAAHYGFTGEELDFIINYDIKYRMGRERGAEE